MRFAIPIIALCAAAAAACFAPKYDGGNLAGKAAILDATRIALTNQDCATAIATIEGLYNSVNTDNEVRLVRASAQGCAAGMNNFFGFMGSIAARKADLAGPGLWKVLAELMHKGDPADTAIAGLLDARLTAGGNSMDSLFAALPPGTVVSERNTINDGSFNEGSTIVTDRLDDANLYLAFIAMTVIGNTHNRWGSPNAAFQRTKNIGAITAGDAGWTVAANVDETANSYASAIVSMIEAIDVVAAKMSGSTAETLRTISERYGTEINGACRAGCDNGSTFQTDPSGNPVTYNTGAGCEYSDCGGSDTRPCLLALRDRKRYAEDTGTETDDKVRCATAGIATYISNDFSGWEDDVP